MKSIGQAELTEHLRALGLQPGDAAMMHASLSRLGHVEGGASTVVEAVLDAMGPDGTLLTPAFTAGLWQDALTMPDCREGCPRDLCPSNQPSHEGAIPNAALARTGRLRSCHPTHSWVGNGPQAARLLRGHRASPTFCGVGNPFEPLVEINGCLLTLGVGVDRITLWHYFEDVWQLPYLGTLDPAARHVSHCTHGRRIQYEFPDLMQDVVRACGILDEGPVGQGMGGVIRARVFRDFLATILTDDPYCLVVRPIDRSSPNLAQDAMRKAERMVVAWQERRVEASKARRPEVFSDEGSRVVREDCPAYAGKNCARDGREVHLCAANDRHPDLFKSGGVFNQHGQVTCGSCSWHHQFPSKGSV
jgi:aminoglycoside N3'-acetyltransferase